jgi:drug/metabolite transporter (DMT)-like permease
MHKLLESLKRVFFVLCVIAFFINIFLYVFGAYIPSSEDAFDLQMLSLFNMLMLSFVLLREPNSKT